MMAKRRKISPEVQRLKSQVRSKIRTYNRQVDKLGAPDMFKFNESLAGLRTKKQVNAVLKRLERQKKDPIIKNREGLYLRQSDVRRINKAKAEANKRLRKNFEEQRQRERDIKKKWGYTESNLKPTTKRQVEVPQYTRGVDDFKTYKELLKFEQRLREAGTGPGAHGEELKERIIKAIRGEVFTQANGFKFRGGAHNPLAEFIEENMTGAEVDFFFGGLLNFGYIYATVDGLIKEFEIVDQIVTNPEYPKLKEKWEADYAEEWHDYMEAELELTSAEEIEASASDFEALYEYLDNM